jgi:hypothetical protein
MINNNLFYKSTSAIYPPFKNGLYLEEYFLKKILEEKPVLKRKYIPALWTNFQIENWFVNKKDEMQKDLDEWFKENPSREGYFTVIQHDDGSKLDFKGKDVLVYGCCSGDIEIPLIYEDKKEILSSLKQKSFMDKKVLCSFVGNLTHNVRHLLFNILKDNHDFILINSGGWNISVNKALQYKFLDLSLDSKFMLCPRGAGRSSFRFFEAFKLGCIPVYVWDDKNWLPFKNKIDYSKLCVVVHESELKLLHNILDNINIEKYNQMKNYYNSIKYLYSLDGVYNEIISSLSV